MAKRKRTTVKAVQQMEDKPFELPKIPVMLEEDDAPLGDDGMTDRQRAFVLHYVGDAGFNASKAARLAGYRDDNIDSLKATASENLTKPYIQRAIERELTKNFGTPDDVRKSIAAIARANAADYLKRGDDGKLHFDLDKMTEAGALGLIQELREEGIDEEGGKFTLVKRKLKLYDKLKALEILAKMNGQLVERRDITSNGKSIRFTLNISGDNNRSLGNDRITADN